ncbi:hypothetical protein [Herminiimonas sp. CN]|uniref:hypothetical protein n=1 Tax=Herminiimonas sp. CN TaxID=1349818 RepID=UPI0012DFE64F|nr:hypothetical protein [Herminiimonas sp. CN]
MKKEPIHTSTACNACVPPPESQELAEKCDCLNFCGDDPWIDKEKATPCAHYKRKQAAKAKAQAQTQALSNVEALLAQHGAMLEGNPYCYFELAYTRQTGWMAFICDKPAGGTIGTPEFGAGRKIITSGQGDTPNKACANALIAIKVQA